MSNPHLVRLSDKLKVGPLHDGVNRARLLTEAAVDALSHVDVIARRAAAAVLAFFRLDRDRLRRAHLRACASTLTNSSTNQQGEGADQEQAAGQLWTGQACVDVNCPVTCCPK